LRDEFLLVLWNALAKEYLFQVDLFARGRPGAGATVCRVNKSTATILVIAKAGGIPVSNYPGRGALEGSHTCESGWGKLRTTDKLLLDLPQDLPAPHTFCVNPLHLEVVSREVNSIRKQCTEEICSRTEKGLSPCLRWSSEEEQAMVGLWFKA